MKNLNEYKIITDRQFEEWKSNWNPKDPIPLEIHDYMNKHIIPQIDVQFEKLASFKA